ncbi:hypothetical protein GCM10022227_32840 [Streptomyces sedi]
MKPPRHRSGGFLTEWHGFDHPGPSPRNRAQRAPVACRVSPAGGSRRLGANGGGYPARSPVAEVEGGHTMSTPRPGPEPDPVPPKPAPPPDPVPPPPPGPDRPRPRPPA